ncbi:hypothetical protein QUF64_03020 [Anaerolineales bacterium HSG6]|nr:hypothetical protein [Anaerolineales bacterium HSG6]
MSIEKPTKLLAQWSTAELKIERAIGQILQHIVALYNELTQAHARRQSMQNEIKQLKQTVKTMQAQIDALVDFTGMPPDHKSKRGRGRPRKT